MTFIGQKLTIQLGIDSLESVDVRDATVEVAFIGVEFEFDMSGYVSEPI